MPFMSGMLGGRGRGVKVLVFPTAVGSSPSPEPLWEGLKVLSRSLVESLVVTAQGDVRVSTEIEDSSLGSGCC